MRSRPVAVVLATIAAFILATSAAAASPGAAGDGQPVIVVFQDNVAHPATSAASLTVALGARPTFVYSHALKGFAAKLPASAIAALRANPTIRSVEPDGPAMLADTTQTPATWGLDRIDQRTLPLNNAYTYAATGSGVQVYIIDSGIRFDHVDFGGRATLGADYVGDGRNGVDCNGHGTHVAGTVGGQVYGVAKAVSLIAVRTHDCAGNSTWSQVIAGVDFVTGQKQASPNTPMVANMSIQGSPDAATNTAVANSIAAGVSYAVAAGNGVLFGGDACGSTPALVPAAMTVGATTSSDGRAFYSNYGSCVDWFAPGDNITSDGIASTTATAVKSGTSMAAPATAGVAALYLQNHPNATPQEVRDALFQATTKGVVTSSNSTNNNLLYSLFAAAPPVLTTITVAPSSASVQTGGTQGFSATGLDQYGQALSPQPSFAWSVSGGGTISSSGLFSAGSTAGGPFTVTAASGGLTGTASVSVTAAPPVLTTITVAPSSASVQTGGTQGFSATGLDQYGQALSPQPSFAWSVSGGGTISSSGLFSAGSTAGGPFTVTAASGGLTGTASVSVTAAPPVLTTITVAPSSASVQTGGTQGFSATGLDQYGQALSPQPSFAWSVSGGGTISSSGLFSAGSTAGGPFTVTAASGGLTGTASVSVTDFSLSASPTSRSIKRGQGTSYSVTVSRLQGFTPSVGFTVTGLPVNATAAFAPASTTGTSVTLTVSTSGRTPRGTYTLTITGASGSLKHAITVSLTLK